MAVIDLAARPQRVLGSCAAALKIFAQGIEEWKILISAALAGLSREAAEKLRRIRPVTVGQASRVAGVSPADVAVLLVLARRERVEGSAV